MNKMTKKLFAYFAIVASVLAITVFVGFYSIFRYYTIQQHEQELKTRAETIKVRVEQYMECDNGIQELNAYIKVLDDISLADTYFIIQNGRYFSSSCSCNTAIAIDKLPTKEIRDFAENVFQAGEYMQTESKDSEDRTYIRVGIPVKENDIITAVVVIDDIFEMDQNSFWLSIFVLIGCLILALGISLGISHLLAKRFMHPIQKIALTTKELARGNYQVKTGVLADNEFGELAKETDMLAEKLDYANKESARMEQMQKDYITNISHELRTPVTVIRSSIEALHDGIVPEEKIADYQKQMLNETIELQRLVNDMLEISRLENKEFPIEKESLDLGFVLEDAVRAIRMVAQKQNIRLHYENIEKEWIFEGDYGRLRQMFIVALDNAIKFSEDNKDIWINTKETEKDYYISIQDEGCGIPKEKIPFIFNKFYRISNENTNGTGLGMVIMKSIAQRHEIEIQLESTENVGTKITFIVPLMK